MSLRFLAPPLALCVVLMASQVAAATAPTPAERPSAAFTATMAELVRDGRWADALRLLDTLPKAVRDAPDLLYFRAQVLRKVNRPTAAIDIYNRLLSLQPDAQLIRLELAQTYYDLGDDPASERYFRLALAGELAPQDSKLAHEYLAAIVHRAAWRISTNLTLGADSNLNAGPDGRAIQIFGLPFVLSDQAHRNAGFEVGGLVTAERSTPLIGPVRLDTIVQASGVYTPRRAFDALSVGGQAGPQLVLGEATFSTRGSWERAWFGGRQLYDAYGVTAEAHVPRGPATLWEGAVSVRRFGYAANEDYSGVLTTIDLQRTRFLSPTAFWRVTLALADNNASADYQSYRLASVGVGYFTTLPLGLSLFGKLEIAPRRYEGFQPLFDVRRRDLNTALQLRLTKRDFTLRGFAPYLEATAEHNTSNVGLYKYDRQRLQFGVSRSF